MKYLFYSLFFLLSGFFFNIASAQDSSKVEWIKVYFNMPSDTTVALPGNRSNDNRNLVHTLTDLIDKAKYSVDLCVYDIEHPDLADALVAAKKRGVRVRVVTDNFNRTDGGILDEEFLAKLASAGIYSIDDDGDIYNPDGSISDTKKLNSGADMHSKFVVIDYLSPSKEDYLVWTGSTNMTYTGNFNTNTTIVIKDSGVAETYLKEFEVMWGGSGDIPDQKKAAFHKDKPFHSQPVHWVGDTKVEIYFAPLDREKKKPLISDRIVEVVKKHAKRDIKFSAFSITPGIPISNALWDIADSDITLDGVISSEFYSRYRNMGAIWASEKAREGNRNVQASKELRKLHHKTILIDAQTHQPDEKAITITGSYNFSNNADYNNDENLLIIYSNKIANQFYQDFKGIQNRALGIWAAPKPDLQAQTDFKPGIGSDANSLTVEIVPGFKYPIFFDGIKAPWIYRGPDKTTYFAKEAKAFLETLIKNKKVHVVGLTWNEKTNRYYGQIFINNLDIGLALISKGMAEPAEAFLLSEADVQSYKEAYQDAYNRNLGMWHDKSKARSVIPVQKKDDLKYLMENPININEADVTDFQRLPGIGPSKAQAIIAYREENGFFNTVMELVKVKGIGEKTIQKLSPYLTTLKTTNPDEEELDED